VARQHRGRGGGNGLVPLSAGPGRTRRTHGLSGPTNFGPKSETEMGARGHVRTTLSVWVALLHGHVRTVSGRLG
jgi:hypothetical protein